MPSRRGLRDQAPSTGDSAGEQASERLSDKPRPPSPAARAALGSAPGAHGERPRAPDPSADSGAGGGEGDGGSEGSAASGLASGGESGAGGGDAGERGGGDGGGRTGGAGGGSQREPVEVAIVSIGALAMWRRLGWALALAGLLWGLVWLALMVPIVSVPLLISLIIAYLLAPLVDRLERWGIARTLGIAILVVGSLGILSGAVAIVVPLVADDIRRVPTQAADLAETASAWIESTFGYAVPTSGDEIRDALTEWFDDIEDAESWIGSAAQVVFGRTVSAIGMLFGFAMIPVFSFFLLRDFGRILAALKALVPPHHQDVVVKRAREIDSALGGFVRGQLIVAGILAVLYSIGLWSVDLPLASLVGIIAGLGNMIPFLGTAVGLIIATLVALLEWQGIVQLLLVYAVFAGVQALESWLITPNIVGNRVGLSPFGVIIAVLAFGELFGFLGILLAVPLAAVLKIFVRATVDAYRQSEFFARQTP